MGEIRSTLDIIMEKTKGLTMSDEEKRALREREISGRIKGLVQRYRDSLLALDRLKVEMGHLQERDKDAADRLMREELFMRFEPENENDGLLRVLEEIFKVDAEPIRQRFSDLKAELEEDRSSYERVLLERLKKRGISGSALMPNVVADRDWQALVSRKIQKAKEESAALLNGLSPGFKKDFVQAGIDET